MTRYAIRRTDDGRYLTLQYRAELREDRRIVPLWVPELSRAWTWPTMTEANMAAMIPQYGIGLPAGGDWTVEAVAA